MYVGFSIEMDVYLKLNFDSSQTIIPCKDPVFTVENGIMGTLNYVDKIPTVKSIINIIGFLMRS